MKLHTKNGGGLVDFSDSEIADEPLSASVLPEVVALAVIVACIAVICAIASWLWLRAF